MSYLATFKPIQLGKDEDLKKASTQLYQFGEQLQFDFANLTFDNLSKDFVDTMSKREEQERVIRTSVDEVYIEFNNLDKNVKTYLQQTEDEITFLIDKGSVVDELNTRISVYNESIHLSTGQFTINTNNFSVDAQGNAVFKGSIKGGSININNMFKVDQIGNVYSGGEHTTSVLNPTRGVYADELIIYNYEYNYIPIEDTVTVQDELVVNEYLYAHEVIFFSDARLKENIKNIENGYDEVKKLRLRSYRYIKNQKEGIGYVAQEIESQLPLVKERNYKMVTYASFFAIYLKAIQENQEKIDRLKEVLHGSI